MGGFWALAELEIKEAVITPQILRRLIGRRVGGEEDVFTGIFYDDASVSVAGGWNFDVSVSGVNYQGFLHKKPWLNWVLI